MVYQCTEERFLEDIKNHEMIVLLDNKVYRHLRFKRPDSSSYQFDIVTYPNHIVISGDMGSFVMSRLFDMFNFIRTDDNDFNKNKNGLSINLSYWQEKIVSGKESTEEFSIDLLKKTVNNYIDSHLDGEGWTESEIDDLISDIESEINYCDSNSVRLFDMINEYVYDNDDETESGEDRYFKFDDWWEYHSHANDYTFDYIWKCYALAYAVREYDKFKQGEINE